MANGIKIKKQVEQEEVAAFLRELADAFEHGGKEELECVNDFQKIKIAIKNEFGQISLEAKLKTTDGCEEPEDETPAPPAKPKYKHIKKRMKSSFKLLVKMIHDGQTPPEEAVQSFLEDSALMVTYSGHGDEYYEEYTQACDAFKAAYEAGDMTKMHEAIDVLVHEKSRCHAKYD